VAAAVLSPAPDNPRNDMNRKEDMEPLASVVQAQSAAEAGDHDGARAGTGSGAGGENAAGARTGAANRISNAIFDLLGQVPESAEQPHRDPGKRSRSIANRAAAKAALSAGSLALPPGPLGWLTILPELRTVWKQQAQMVADIAGSFGKSPSLTREQMLYCLFRHIAPAAFLGMVTETGDRVVFSEASPRALRAIVQKIGLRITLRVLSKGVSRWVPMVGALGVGAYAFRDTGQVANTAIALFSRDIQAPGTVFSS
jgi:hypothetical protein